QLKAMGNYCKNKSIIPVAYDIEDTVQTNAVKKGKITKDGLFKNVCKFGNKIKSYGYVPVVYSFQSFFQKYLDVSKLQKKGYKIWYAQWPYYNHLDTTVKKEMYNETIADVWQFSDYLTIGGKRFDTNVCYDDFYDYSKETSKIKVEGLKEVYNLNNETVKPSAFSVYNGSTLLKKGKDYKLAYFKNNRSGTAKLKIIRYKNSKYLETKTLFFDVKPRTPQNIVTTSYLSEVEISWDKSKGASYYQIFELDPNDGTYNLVDTVKTNSYTNIDLLPGQKYEMKIRAVYDKGGKKYYSKYTEFSAYTKYTKVNIDSVTSQEENIAVVKWEPKEENCTGYEIQYSTNSNFKNPKSTRVITGINRKQSTFKKLTSCKKYYFRIRAFNELDSKKIYSTYSKTLSVKIK
ncbi:MAG: fibronectin type III domain-containing protein, partial [Ruminococcus sp.]|nr:fibronectin type III domain-containing protein [Ruminococcus sp.]